VGADIPVHRLLESGTVGRANLGTSVCGVLATGAAGTPLPREVLAARTLKGHSRTLGQRAVL